MTGTGIRPPAPATLARRPLAGGLAALYVNVRLADGSTDYRTPPPTRTAGNGSPGMPADPDEIRTRIEAGEVLVAPRDASAYNYPPTSAGPRSHAGGRYHAITPDERARCSGAPVVLGLARAPGDVDVSLICPRRPCQAAVAKEADSGLRPGKAHAQ